MLKVRLQRGGRKKRPFYRVVVIDHTKGPSGKYIEKIGYYNPLSNPKDFKINEERLAFWLSCGAKTSETVAKLVFRYCSNKKLIKDFGIDKIVENLRKKPKRPPKSKKPTEKEGEEGKKETPPPNLEEKAEGNLEGKREESSDATGKEG